MFWNNTEGSCEESGWVRLDWN